jgi:iron complex transport system ATP-binding protein
MTHVLLLRGGRVIAAGPIETTLTPWSLSECFRMPLGVERRDGRWTARAFGPAVGPPGL